MDPQNNNPYQNRDPRSLRIPQRRFVASSQPQHDARQTQQEMAANMVRQQISQIYDTAPPNQPKEHAKPSTKPKHVVHPAPLAAIEPAPQPQEVAAPTHNETATVTQPQATQEPENPYQRTHQDNFDWREYHTAWQDYYQKYYERYYWQQLHAERQKLAAEAADKAVAKETGVEVGVDPAAPAKNKVEAIKKDITDKVKKRADKVRKSHHFIPLLSAIGVGVVFIFLQFNSVVFAQIQSYISPGAISSDAISIDPSTPVNVGPEAKLIIPKINVEVPVDYGVTNISEANIQTSLRDGATHYKLPGADAVPGQKGNTVILGHSSNDIFNQGAYKFVFVQLDRLQPGDIFYLHYEGTRYIYRMTSSKVIDPTEVSALQIGNDKAMATLITCTPPGTALKRLLIFAEQISPDPGAASAPAAEQAQTETPANNTLIGNEPSWLDQIWQFFF
jgi:sortase A